MSLPGFWELLVILVIVVLVFGAKRLPSVMGDVAKGIKEFRKGMADESKPAIKSDKATPKDE